jgi:lipoprotein NlpI
MRVVYIVILLAFFAGAARPILATPQEDELTKGIAAATKTIDAAPKQPNNWMQRARLYSLQRQYAKAVADYTEAIKLDPKREDAWQRRGEEQFKRGNIAESISDFEQFLSLVPGQRPYHWQLGISLYYAGHFVDGKKLFELHQTVNSNDVENAVWHFLCTARAEGLEAARKKLIPIENDGRVPMSQVHQLFSGKATPNDVLAAAKAAPSQTRAGEPLFYANLYLGLYYEAIGNTKLAKDYILKAGERSNENGYMGDVARVHAEILKKLQPKGNGR